MRYSKTYSIVAMAAAASIGATAMSWAGGAGDESGPQKDRTSAPRVTEPLRAEHQKLRPHIEALAAAGDAIGTAPLEEQRKKVHASYTFLSKQLIPHAVAEDKVLYAKVDSLIGRSGSTRATDTMRRDHTEIDTLTNKLGELDKNLQRSTPSPAQERQLRRVLYSLNSIVDLHFAKEDEVYLPLLDRELTAAQAQQLFEQMEKISSEQTATESGPRH